jgi:hypothetical protein
MKTAERILEEKYADIGTRLKDFDKWCIEEAMKAYAEQAIDMCAEKIWDCYESYELSSDNAAPAQTMLDLKKLLK